MPTRFEAAVHLDISLEMAKRHGIPSQISAAALQALSENPPAWLQQSRMNRVAHKPVWVTVTCELCDVSETLRPKKWWPAFTAVLCDEHDVHELPAVEAGMVREYSYGIGSRFTGVLDSAASASR